MGHATAIVKVSLDYFSSTSPSSREIMDRAVGIWYDMEAGRWADSRHCYPALSPVSTEKVARNLIDDGESVGDEKSKIIPLTEDYVRKTSTVRLQLTGKELAALRRGNHWSTLGDSRFGENVVAVEITQLPKPRAPRAEATEGKSVTLYRVVDSNGNRVLELEPHYPSQAEARAAAVEHMREHFRYHSLAVEGFVRRDSGSSALVRITRPEPETATVSFKVTTETPKPKAKLTGYLVAFDYHD